MTRPSDEEIRLSATLNALIGELNCEVMLLPTRNEMSGGAPAVEGYGDIDCHSAIVAVLRCALDLGALRDLDVYSRAWIADAMESCDRALEKLGCAHGDASPGVMS